MSFCDRAHADGVEAIGHEDADNNLPVFTPDRPTAWADGWRSCRVLVGDSPERSWRAERPAPRSTGGPVPSLSELLLVKFSEVTLD